MASGDQLSLPRHLTYSKSKIPVIGALIDYVDTSVDYLRRSTFAQAERLHAKASRATLSASFMAMVCLLLGLVANVKLEVVMKSNEPLDYDLHFMLLSKDDHFYMNDVNINKVMWCLEMSDLVVVTLSCLLIWNSSNVRSPLSEYMYLPWFGATLRGLFLRQGPTAVALFYTLVHVNGKINPLFLTAFSFLFLLEARLWLEVVRVVRLRLERREQTLASGTGMEVETLWSNDDVHSVEVLNTGSYQLTVGDFAGVSRPAANRVIRGTQMETIILPNSP